jgi:hypothetical protein
MSRLRRSHCLFIVALLLHPFLRYRVNVDKRHNRTMCLRRGCSHSARIHSGRQWSNAAGEARFYLWNEAWLLITAVRSALSEDTQTNNDSASLGPPQCPAWCACHNRLHDMLSCETIILRCDTYRESSRIRRVESPSRRLDCSHFAERVSVPAARMIVEV